MNVQFLGQGYEENSPNAVGTHLIRLLADENFQKLTILTAFASPSGVLGLLPRIDNAKAHLKEITIITGVDQKGTSDRALESLIELDVNAFVFYQPSNPIFHPKMYFFEGGKISTLIIGSSNLTVSGLFTNIEASLLVELENIVDGEVISQVKDYFHALFDETDPNLKRLDQTLINNLVKAKVVPTEKERRQLYNKVRRNVSEKAKKLLLSIFPRRKTPTTPKEFRTTSKPKTKTRLKKPNQKNIAPLEANPMVLGEIAWVRKNLPASSVQASPGGNPTGGLRLVQADFQVDGKTIDQTSYFRNEVFGNLQWTASGNSEVSTTSFNVLINGNSIGVHELQVRHKPSGEAGQGNYTTLISWGEIGEIIKSANLTGTSLTLHYPINKYEPYVIKID